MGTEQMSSVREQNGAVAAPVDV
ncbi:unnamed protein product [Urochloa humidicola]